MKRIICTSNEDIIYQNLLEYISSKFKVNGPDYRGARQPEFHSLMVNESEFGDNLRYKSYVCDIKDGGLDVFWVTQEPFLDSETYALVNEIQRCIDCLYDEYYEEMDLMFYPNYPTVDITIECRHGRDLGYYETSFK